MLIIDNYDSFTYNIVQYLQILGIEPIVIKNDELSIKEIENLKFSRILLSPGWGNPENSGVTMDVIDLYQDSKSILGVCLGMQCIAKYYGLDIVNAPEPCQGKTSAIYYDDDFQLFKGLRQGFSATRYHSLIVSGMSKNIDIKAKTADNIPMALKVKDKEIYGVQFHPESILTESGIDIFKNWLELCNVEY